MKIQVFMPVFNEADILEATLRHLRGQGCAVHAIEGYSTDGSDEILHREARLSRERHHDPLPVTVEQFPVPDDGIWNCTRMLSHIEELALESRADWCGLSDADEWRRSPYDGETLAAAIARADAAGFNCINFQVFAFWPTDDGWLGFPNWSAADPEPFFRYFSTDDMICRLPQRKFWKRSNTRVDLVSSGGHEAKFPGRRTSPEVFTMKHYPFRSSIQARRRLLERLERRCSVEHAKGWGVHYDAYARDQRCFWNPADLQYWEDPARPLP